jgi:hypothetical protein
MPDDYDAYARDLHRKATAAHLEWVKSLSPEQRKKLGQMGILQPAEDRSEVGGHSPWQERDAAESHYARIESDPGDLDSPAERIADYFEIPITTARRVLDWHRTSIESALFQHEGDLLAIVVGGLLAAQNPRLSAAGLAFATNLDATNGLGSMAAFGRTLNISRQAVSKVTKAWQRDLGLKPGANQKSTEACEKYSAIGLSDHWRKKKVKAADLLARFKKTAPLN